MGFNTSGTIEAVDNIVGHLMGYRITETVLIIFGKQPGIVSNAPLFAAGLVHAGAFAFEIKVYGDAGKVAAIVV